MRACAVGSVILTPVSGLWYAVDGSEVGSPPRNPGPPCLEWRDADLAHGGRDHKSPASRPAFCLCGMQPTASPSAGAHAGRRFSFPAREGC